jgi:hypothetical protein
MNSGRVKRRGAPSTNPRSGPHTECKDHGACSMLTLYAIVEAMLLIP